MTSPISLVYHKINVPHTLVVRFADADAHTAQQHQNQTSEKASCRLAGIAAGIVRLEKDLQDRRVRPLDMPQKRNRRKRTHKCGPVMQQIWINRNAADLDRLLFYSKLPTAVMGEPPHYWTPHF